MTATDRLIEAGVEVRYEHRPFFDVPDTLAKSHEQLRESISIAPSVRSRLINVLMFDPRFRGIGYSEFITRALDMLGCTDG